MEEMYDVFTFIAVAFLRSDPASWPPNTDSPWLSTSLHDFWGRRWQQHFRRPFFLLGGYPFALLVSSLLSRRRRTITSGSGAIAFGTFVASGLHHTWNPYAGMKGTLYGPSCFLFFVAQSVGLSLERMWKKRTGRPVGGLGGWLWVVLWIVVGGQPFSMFYYFIFRCLGIDAARLLLLFCSE